MKKTILISTVIGALILMTSCLGEINNSYDEAAFVYITVDDKFSVYGKTISPARAITATEMLTMNPGSFYFLNYSWVEEYGTKPLNVDGELYQADVVKLGREPITVEDRYLILSPLPEVEESNDFINIEPYFYSHSPDYTGDKWLFQYTYDRPKDKTPDIKFYKRDNVESNSDNIVIDIHLTYKDATEEVAASNNATDYLALDMSAIRNMYEGNSSTTTKELKISFVYKLKGGNEPIKTKIYPLLVKGS